MTNRKAPPLPRHMATLNLFREPDGTYEITVAEARGYMAHIISVPGVRTPLAEVENMIVAAAERMKARHEAARIAPLVGPITEAISNSSIVIEPKRHDHYWTDGRGLLHCRHGIILYGDSCLACERGE